MMINYIRSVVWGGGLFGILSNWFGDRLKQC